MENIKTMSLEKYIEIFKFENGRDPEIDEAKDFFKWTANELHNRVRESTKIVLHSKFVDDGFKIYLDIIGD